MDVAGGWGNPINKSLMTCNRLVVPLTQFLEPLPTAVGAIEVDDLKPVRPRVNQRLPTVRIERDALDVATAPFVDHWQIVPAGTSFPAVLREPFDLVIARYAATSFFDQLNSAPSTPILS